ncbi:MAG: hypothetical protein K5787_02885 [Lentisphaeria bacterium]|nr:hypothetical protein [Lentisphaeria bacterium]
MHTAMKNFFLAAIAFSAAEAFCHAQPAATAKKTPRVSATIDFLDYVFFMHKGPEDYYPLEEYEKEIKQLADAGIKKIYLRVNVCGLTHYPSKVSAQYGENGALHWTFEKEALRLVETYKHYNPCTETIRIGHKYDMEVWAWESLHDDAGVCYSNATISDRYDAIYQKLGGWALLDPFYLDNPDALAEIDPQFKMLDVDVKKINEEARRLPIGKIVFMNPENRKWLPLGKITKDNLRIYISQDNKKYTLYDKSFSFLARKVNGRNQIVLSDLNITQPYIKLDCTDNSSSYSMVITQLTGEGELYNTDGQLVPSVWNWGSGDPEKSWINFSQLTGPAAWDYQDRCVGCLVGVVPQTRYYLGVVEYATQKGMQHGLDRFRELAEYPFDGFMFNTRCHSARADAERYGFNPEVLAKFKARYGHDYGGAEADKEGVCQIRAEGIADFFKNCKKMTNGRPIYMSAPMPIEMKNDPNFNTNFGPLPWLYKRYFTDGSIDGVVMIGKNWHNGTDFSAYFTDEITDGRPVKIGIFREGAKYGKDMNFFLEDMGELLNANLDEIEFYESMILNQRPAMLDFIKKRIK